MKKKYKFNTRQTLEIIYRYNNPSELKEVFNKWNTKNIITDVSWDLDDMFENEIGIVITTEPKIK
tara:strand:+ start:692 stop:886 length:195 start_codon:yes stop_codon:yes gene_type:complete